MTRNSWIWWLGMAAAVLTFVADQFGMLHMTSVSQDRVKFVALLIGIISGYLRMSPLALSPDSTLAGQVADPTKTLTPIGSVKKDEPKP